MWPACGQAGRFATAHFSWQVDKLFDNLDVNKNGVLDPSEVGAALGSGELSLSEEARLYVYQLAANKKAWQERKAAKEAAKNRPRTEGRPAQYCTGSKRFALKTAAVNGDAKKVAKLIEAGLGPDDHEEIDLDVSCFLPGHIDLEPPFACCVAHR